MNSTTAGEPRQWDFLLVDPEEIEVCGTDSDTLSKWDRIVETAVSMHKYGQRQAVECLRVAGQRLQLVHGLVRVEAARLIRAGLEYVDPATTTKTKIKNKSFRLWVKLNDPN